MSGLVVKTLHAAVDWVVKESYCDFCQVCLHYNKEREQMEAVKGEVDPCPHHRKRGEIACRDGIIEHFQSKIINPDHE